MSEKRFIPKRIIDSCKRCPFKDWSEETYYRYGYDVCSQTQLNISSYIYNDTTPIHPQCPLPIENEK